jgi:lysophospholipase L1-like esterase
MKLRMASIVLIWAAAAVAQAQAPAPTPAAATVRRSMGDIAALGRYAADNAKVSPPAGDEARIVFMGDSITDFWGRRYGKFFPGKPYINRGISGQITPQMLLRFRQDVIALKPKVAVILGGTNDIGGSLGPVPPEATHTTSCRWSTWRGPMASAWCSPR